MTKMVKNSGYDDKKDRKRVEREGKKYWAHQVWLQQKACQGCQKAFTKSISCSMCGTPQKMVGK